jgi:hypothetical protein
MGLRRRSLLATAATVSAALVIEAPGAAYAAPTDPVPVPLADLFNNNGIGVGAGDANLDGSGYSFPAGGLPSWPVTVAGLAAGAQQAVGEVHLHLAFGGEVGEFLAQPGA